ncbi:Esterase EstB [bacterium HR26]|nr:Esterase EstB [bacterium HR26]
MEQAMMQQQALSGATERIARFIEAGEISGAGLAVALGGQLVLEWYGGEAAPSLPAGPETLWPLASITKLYTAATIMALVERGVLTLGTPVRAVLPEFDGDGREAVTIHHLLTHTSGLLYEPEDMETLLRQQLPLDELVEAAFSEPLQFQPGTQVSYSDLGYAIAGMAAEEAAGRPFPALVRELVLEPAGLRETYFPLPPDEAGRLARVTGALAEGTPGHMYGPGYGLRLAHPAWGVVASLPDLLRFGLLFTPHAPVRILSRAAIRAMTSNQVGLAADGGIWGIGFELAGGHFGEGDLLSPASFGHSGATGCTVWVEPEADLVLAYVSNRHLNAGREAFVRRLATVINMVLAALT